MQAHTTAAILVIAALAAAGVIVRPWRLPEAVSAVLGATALVVLGLLSWSDALAGILKGLDVYLFLTGMMLLAELARREGLFDWLAALAVEHAKGSAQRLFTLIYGVGIAVTVLLSNDATAVVLTPAVYAAARAAGATPRPHLLICAFVANAASFVLPISNPANLVVFGSRMPHLSAWLAQFLLPSILAIGATYIGLWLCQYRTLVGERIASAAVKPKLSTPGLLTAAGIACTGIALLGCSAFDLRLGLPTFLGGSLTAVIVITAAWRNPLQILGGVSWSVLPLVAGLFVLVEGLDRTGAIAELGRLLRMASADSAVAALGVGGTLAFVCNVMNNLAVGLIAGSVLATDHLPHVVSGAMLIGVDLGPNLSITGSLATILWLIALRREGEDVSAWQFLKLGAVIMPLALVFALAAVVLIG
jgi:arsenical pump membrane protein